jgi:hypothetical protein
MTDDGINKVRRKIAGKLARMALWKTRDMSRRLHRPRTFRLPKMARMLKSVVAEAQAAGVLPPPQPSPGKRPGSTARR